MSFYDIYQKVHKTFTVVPDYREEPKAVHWDRNFVWMTDGFPLRFTRIKDRLLPYRKDEE